ncbi:hypothetical protein Q8F55_000672 [Vanrija albida]|uniref:FHF complex subunit HOOK-interacting protein C-terminal domain-containing protein n=1 Tax=Vanrija albida TaxID=181172 RepID=A0ABR3QEU8_9TREE
MEVSTFFTRLLQAPKPAVPVQAPDDFKDFEDAWLAVKDTLEHPDERQLRRGILATDVPRHLKHLVDALVYESNRTDEDTTGACLEYFLRNDMLAQLERLCERDRPHGIKAEVLRTVNNLVVLLSERFLVHNAVHRPLRRLLRSCIGDLPEEHYDGEARVFGAAADEDDYGWEGELEEDLVDLMCILCSRMRAYPPLLLIFFHDKGWLMPHTSSGAPQPGRALSPAPSIDTARSKTVSTRTADTEATAAHFEFLLFSYLLRFVHREGRTGDFARAGLLFLFDITFLPPGEEGADNLSLTPVGEGLDPLQDARDALAEYILDGDFADVMAAGLGAAYSVLPTKLQVPSLAELASVDGEKRSPASAPPTAGMIIGAGAKKDDDSERDDLIPSTDIDVRNQLDTLIKQFGFLQDILYRCSSPTVHADPLARTVSSAQVLGRAVSDATLDAIQTAFVDNVLYPSILECSSTDGSAVAVLTYLNVLLGNLEDGAVLHRILDALMDTTIRTATGSPSQERPRRKTGAMDYVPATGSAPNYHAEDRFTLRDLILENLQSENAASVAAAMHLVYTLLGDHCGRVTPSLLAVVRDPIATATARRTLPPVGAKEWAETHLPKPVNSTDVHLQEPELYSALVPRLDDALQGGMDTATGFAAYLSDTHALIEVDRCWQLSRIPLQFVSDDGKPALLRVGDFAADPLQHSLSPSDPLVQSLMGALCAWFTASPDENVALTGSLAAIARCPNRSLSGWLLYDIKEVPADPWEETERRGSQDSVASSDDERNRTPVPSRTTATLPALYQIIRGLTRHIGRFRGTVEDFDRLLAERRQGLLFTDHLDEAMNAMLDVEQSHVGFGLPPLPPPSLVPSTPPLRKQTLASSIRALWSPRKKRGSQPSTPTPGTPVLNASTPNAPGTPTTPSRPLPVATPGALAPPAGSQPQLAASPPFKTHYTQLEESGLLDVAPVLGVTSGTWAKRATEGDSGTASPAELATATKASLTSILDNCIVLEELIKELVAIITARRALGVDQVGFM